MRKKYHEISAATTRAQGVACFLCVKTVQIRIARTAVLSYTPPHILEPFGALHSLVVRQLWELDVGGSNPSAPTNFLAKNHQNTNKYKVVSMFSRWMFKYEMSC